MPHFVKVGRHIINIDAIARIDTVLLAAETTEAQVHLMNGEYVMLKEREAAGLLEFFGRLSAVPSGDGAGAPDCCSVAFNCEHREGYACEET